MADDLKRPGTLATAMLLALSVVAAACVKQSEVGPLHGPAEVCALNRVVDGDGVRLHCGRDRENLNIRLQCIDAPEPDQPPWGSEPLSGCVTWLDQRWACAAWTQTAMEESSVASTETGKM